MLHMGNSVFLKNISDQTSNGLTTDNHSPIWWEVVLSESDSTPPKGPSPLPSTFLVLEKALVLSLYPGPQGKLPRSQLSRPQAVTGSAKHAPGFQKELCHAPDIGASGKSQLDQASTQ